MLMRGEKFYFVLLLCCVLISCRDKGSEYVGRWECEGHSNEYLEIKKLNDNAYLLIVPDNFFGREQEIPAKLDDGVLSITGLWGTHVTLPIDSDTGELICAFCGECNRYKKVK